LGFRWETYEEALEAVKKDAQDILDEQLRKVEEAGGTVAGLISGWTSGRIWRSCTWPMSSASA
jgi:hypothetical protein